MKKIIFYSFFFLLVALLGSQTVHAESHQRWVVYEDTTYVPTPGFLSDMTLALMNGEIESNVPSVIDGITITIAQPDLYLKYIVMCVKSGEPSIVTDEDVIREIANGDVVKWGDDINCKVKNYYFSTAHNEVRFNGNYSGATDGVEVLLINGKPKIKAKCGNPLEPYANNYVPKYDRALKVPDTIYERTVGSHVEYDTIYRTVLLEEQEVPQEQYPATFTYVNQYQQPMCTPMMMPMFMPVFISMPRYDYGNYGGSSNNIDINIYNTNTNTNTNNNDGHHHHGNHGGGGHRVTPNGQTDVIVGPVTPHGQTDPLTSNGNGRGITPRSQTGNIKTTGNSQSSNYRHVSGQTTIAPVAKQSQRMQLQTYRQQPQSQQQKTQPRQVQRSQSQQRMQPRQVQRSQSQQRMQPRQVQRSQSQQRMAYTPSRSNGRSNSAPARASNGGGNGNLSGGRRH
jgi:hypothetical protein